jgi:hypothetical protein
MFMRTNMIVICCITIDYYSYYYNNYHYHYYAKKENKLFLSKGVVLKHLQSGPRLSTLACVEGSKTTFVTNRSWLLTRESSCNYVFFVM